MHPNDPMRHLTPISLTAEGPQPPVPFSPTCLLRWMVSSTPGERPTLQQLWRCDDPDAVERGCCPDEEWRDIGYVDYRERPIV
jgi:hypothetical protein